MNKIIFACVIFASVCAFACASGYYAAPAAAYEPVPYRPAYYQAAPYYKPVPLVAAPVNPSAAASAAAASATLNSGLYSRYVVPSYELVGSEPAYKPVSYKAY